MHDGRRVGCGGLLQRPLLLLFGPVIFNQLCVIFLLLSDLKSAWFQLEQGQNDRGAQVSVLVQQGSGLERTWTARLG